METFDQIIQSDKAVLVDFYADWCGPCQTMMPVVHELAAKLNGKVRVLKINIDKNQAVSARFNVRSVPTFMIFKNGEIVWRHSGTLDKSSFERQLLAFA